MAIQKVQIVNPPSSNGGTDTSSAFYGIENALYTNNEGIRSSVAASSAAVATNTSNIYSITSSLNSQMLGVRVGIENIIELDLLSTISVPVLYGSTFSYIEVPKSLYYECMRLFPWHFDDLEEFKNRLKTLNCFYILVKYLKDARFGSAGDYKFSLIYDRYRYIFHVKYTGNVNNASYNYQNSVSITRTLYDDSQVKIQDHYIAPTNGD